MSRRQPDPAAPPSGPRLLVAASDAALRAAWAQALGVVSGRVDPAASISDALRRIADPEVAPYDLVVCDQGLSGADGVAILAAAHARDPRCAVVLLGESASVESAVEAMRAGAADFLDQPVELRELVSRVSRALEAQRRERSSRAPRAAASVASALDRLVASSPAMADAVTLARRVADSRSTVMVTGETGTGKELIAELLHEGSARSQGPLVKVNCAALPETLLEAELFGHERGAFTGADQRRIGRFEEASGGSLFLDEIGELSGATQAKLLRVIQDQSFRRLGGSELLHTDARLLAATHLDLEEEVRAGSFREDLFFRLDVIRIHLAPLRERPEDVLELARRFLAEAGQGRDQAPEDFAADALAALRAHSWPGNVRELRNAVERALLLCRGPRVRAADLALAEPPGAAGWRPELPPPGWSLDDWERALVEEALRRTDYVQKEACQLLGVSPRKLNYMVRTMGITHPRWRRNRPPDDPKDAFEDPAEDAAEEEPQEVAAFPRWGLDSGDR